mmetsp:Transcript_8383/g.19852  ORF Transcript_8383/g.19852 Transcript_8383/m.19852 type:complete len:189 (+) Transcript_8383:90-656(+)|eukprot:CAMPEP_0198307276 /NCGR_PEP_ID=MMETSP1450-20131203/183_1 /TAXON_ID=753684 ORGANISM="Madagascaria erythrocladiodes, Strain CCMP3234" /NCGR_SAMPLE_ID=MMETSP1450 /ASSEMBLY_ACC=CAM_ASM_001115 /LENGTH=188 /DNA_ID=CAMNT_0044009845 /DNA_START=60 /DNA_END=626 /DNA_ORIENTATION=-
MRVIKSERRLAIPEGVKVELTSRRVKVTGPRGVLERKFAHVSFDMRVVGNEVVITCWFGDRLKLAAVRTIMTHIRNMMTGVVKGYQYKMRLVYAHFPINAAVVDNKTVLEIRNFLGEKIVRRVKMLEGVTIEKSTNVKDQLVLSGNDIELVSQSAANINIACKVRNKDIRKFLDGVYVSEKGHVVQDD